MEDGLHYKSWSSLQGATSFAPDSAVRGRASSSLQSNATSWAGLPALDLLDSADPADEVVGELGDVVAAQARALDDVAAELEATLAHVAELRSRRVTEQREAVDLRGQLALSRGARRELEFTLQKVRQQQAQVRLEREQARLERDQARAERDQARAEREQARTERDAAREERDEMAAGLLEACWIAEQAAELL